MPRLIPVKNNYNQTKINLPLLILTARQCQGETRGTELGEVGLVSLPHDRKITPANSIRRRVPRAAAVAEGANQNQVLDLSDIAAVESNPWRNVQWRRRPAGRLVSQARKVCVWGMDLCSVNRIWNIVKTEMEQVLVDSVVKIVGVGQAPRRKRFDIYIKEADYEVVFAAMAALVGRVPWRITKWRPFLDRVRDPRRPQAGPVRPSRPLGAGMNAPLGRPPVREIGLASWNINGLRLKCTEVERFCQRQNIKILALQETRRKRRGFQLRLLGLNILETPAQPDVKGHHGVMLGIASGIAAEEVGPKSPFFVFARIKANQLGKNQVIVGSVYIPTKGCNGTRRHALTQLKDTVEGLRKRYPRADFVIMGDWNSRTSPLEKMLEKWALGLHVHQTRGSKRTRARRGKASTKEDGEIDHIVTTQDAARLFSHSIVRRSEDASDHWPISMRVRRGALRGEDIAAPPAPKKRKFDAAVIRDKADKISTHNYWDALDQLKCDDPEGLEALADAFVETSYKVADTLGARKEVRVFKTKSKFLLSPETKRVIANRREAYAEVVRRPDSDEKLTRWKRLRAKARALVRSDKTKSWNKHVADVAEAHRGGDTKALWKWVRSLRADGADLSGVKAVRDPASGQLVTDPEAILGTWAKHYARLAEDETGHSRDQNYWTDKLPAPLSELTDLNEPVLWREVNSTLKAIKSGKAAGLDGLTPEWFKTCIEEWGEDRDPTDGPQTPFAKHFYKLVIGVWDLNHIPKRFREAAVVSIPKKGDLTDMDNYRGISLIAIALKVIITLMAQRLGRALEKKRLLIPEQAGFRTEEECIAQVIALWEVVQRRHVLGRKTFACFIDLKKAFDLVPHEALLAKLEQIGVRGKSLAFFRAIYKENYIRVRLPCGISPPVLLKRGVRQGCPASTMLFDIFINDILEEIKRHGLGAAVPGLKEKLAGLLYADDLVLLASSPEELQVMMDILTKWLNKWEMKVGPAKCGVMAFHQDTSAVDGKDWRIQGEKIPVVTRYEYLGIDVIANLDMREVVLTRLRKGEKTLGQVRSFLQTRALPIEVRLSVFKATVLPIIAYGGELYGMQIERVSKMQTLVNQGLRWIIGGRGADMSAPNLCIAEESNQAPMAAVSTGKKVRILAKSKNLRTWLQKLKSYPVKKGFRTWISGALSWLRRYAKDIEAAVAPDEDPNPKLLYKTAVERVWKMKRERNSNPETWKQYVAKGMRKSAGTMRASVLYPEVKQGIALLIRARCGAYWTAHKLAQAKKIGEGYKRSCPFCSKSQRETMGHILNECSAWNGQRIKSGLAGTIGKLAIPSNCQGIEDVNEFVGTVLLGGQNSGVTLMPQWLSGTTQEKDGKSIMIAPPGFIQVAQFLQRVHIGRRKRLRELQMIHQPLEDS
jgi:exonuclease III